MQINEYAKSMFEFEELHPGWITKCTNYLKLIFNDDIKGKTVIDYAFGRGNWSLALLKAGAAKVIAIDAAESNVKKFSRYLDKNGISNIDVRLGNVVERPLDVRADFLWLYGILHHIDQPRQFLTLLNSNLTDDAQGMIYAYNSNCLRETVVTFSRKFLQFSSFAEFQEYALIFTPQARLRVKDDLTAPHIDWYSKEQLATLIDECLFASIRETVSFSDYLGQSNAEFEPLHFCFKKSAGQAPEATALHLREEDNDLNAINDLLSLTEHSLSQRDLRSLSIGLCNTHFTSTAHKGQQQALTDIFLLLFHALRSVNAAPQGGCSAQLFELAENSLLGRPQRLPSNLTQSHLANFLCKNTIRI